MGVERAVTRWYLQRQVILYEIAQLERQIVEMQAMQVPQTNQEPLVEQEDEGVKEGKKSDVGLLLQLQQAQAKLEALGPCPKPMMG
jgi:hypothetical protein